MYNSIPAVSQSGPYPKGPKYQNVGDIYIYTYTHIISVLGIVLVALGIYSVFGYLDPEGHSS